MLIAVGIFWLKWLIAVGVAILLLFLIVFILEKNSLKQLENERKRCDSLINDETQKLNKLIKEKNNVENDINQIQNRYDIT